MSDDPRWLRRLSSPALFTAALVWLMALLVVGTVLQASIGLYRSQELYFSSWFVLAFDWLPLPGGRLTMGVVALNLIAFLFRRQAWRKPGIMVTHLGALALLVGGFISAYARIEGNLFLAEGQMGQSVQSYHDPELAVIEIGTGPGVDTVTAFGPGVLIDGSTLSHPDLPFDLQIDRFIENSRLRPLPGAAPADAQGMAQRFELAELPPEKENERNQRGLRYSSAHPAIAGSYLLQEYQEIPQTFSIDDRQFRLELRRTQWPLPFAVRLLDVEAQYHPGITMPRAFSSEVQVIEEGRTRRVLIEMNQPLRQDGYTFYQAHFDTRHGTEFSGLAVVKDYGYWFPYIATLIMCVGLLIHLFQRLPKLFRQPPAAGAALVLLLAGTAGQAPSAAETAASAGPAAETTTSSATAPATEPTASSETTASGAEPWPAGQIPVQHDGRIKPLDSVARHWLLVFNSKRSVQLEEDGERLAALDWFLELLAGKERAETRRMFHIANPRVAQMVGLDARPDYRYTFRELATAFETNAEVVEEIRQLPEDERSLPEKQLGKVYQKLEVFLDLSQAATCLQPLFAFQSPDLAERYGIPAGDSFSIYELMQRRATFEDDLRRLAELLRAQGEPSDSDTELLRIADVLEVYRRRASDTRLRIVPRPVDEAGISTWSPPWSALVDPDARPVLDGWVQLLHAVTFDDAALRRAALQHLQLAYNQAPQISENRLRLELRYNQSKLFHWSVAFYILALLALAGSAAGWQHPLGWLATGLLGTGLAIHIGGIVMRVLIMQRAPVGNLYESIIFVAAVGALGGLVLELILRNRIGVFIGAALALILQLVGFGYADDGDSMGMLVAVLNSNFWLLTHVLTISTGYSFTYIACLLGHLALASLIISPQNKARLQHLDRLMLAGSLVALFFTLFGTILGGIWADQSWGRFWGWDPKENGALWIVLWLLTVLHARMSGLIGLRGTALALMLVGIVVTQAWFGVNLLGVGLHSYGFTDSILFNLGLYTGIQLALVIIGAPIAAQRQRAVE